jgi:23S rRNA pseudouridine1911/1915/1917 synthase
MQIQPAKSIESPRVLYEGRGFLAVYKPSGVVVHPARIAQEKRKEIEVPLLTDWLLSRYPEISEVGDDPAYRPGIVHRLDKETSGVMLVARSQEYFEYAKKLFQSGQIHKKYLAIVSGIPKPPAGRIDAAIGIRSGTLKRSTRSQKMAKQAVTEYETKETFENSALVEARPLTGRTHQIRVHFASRHFPIAGDKLYGPKKQPEWASRLFLHAYSIEFPAEEGKRMIVEAGLPSEFENTLSYLRTHLKHLQPDID